MVSAAISLAGYHRQALTRGGALAAVLVGFSALRGFGWCGALLLGTFFTSGSALSRKFERALESGDPVSRRALQVVANGGVAALSGMRAAGNQREDRFAMFAGSLAAATADTWATAIGATSPASPRLILSGRQVRPGVSGGVTTRGTVASLVGAMLVGAISGALGRSGRLSVAVSMGGIAGSIVDSLLGETLQVRYRATDAGHTVERRDSATSIRVSGVPYLNNDAVNLACTMTGALLSTLLYRLLAPR